MTSETDIDTYLERGGDPTFEEHVSQTQDKYRFRSRGPRPRLLYTRVTYSLVWSRAGPRVSVGDESEWTGDVGGWVRDSRVRGKNDLCLF